jgi:hypothetical protein
MDYIIIGVLLAIGWFIIRFVYDVVSEIIFCNLHHSELYAAICGKRQKKNVKKKEPEKRIGF